MPKGKSRKSNPELYAASAEDLDDPAVIEMEETAETPGEEIPTAVSADEPKRAAGSGPKRSYKPRKKKVPVTIPPQVLAAIGEAPFLLTGMVYEQRTGRSLDFSNPVQVAQMHQASLDAFAESMNEIGIEAPPWLVWAGMTSLAISSAIGVDIMRMKAAIMEKENLDRQAAQAARAKADQATTPAATGVAPVSLVD